MDRIATWKTDKGGRSAVLIRIDQRELTIAHADLITYDTAEKLKAEIERQASLSDVELPELFFHVNRDNSIALATGSAPKVWPEDEIEMGLGA